MLETAWAKLSLENTLSEKSLSVSLAALRKTREQLSLLREDLMDAKDVPAFAEAIPDHLLKIGDQLRKECATVFTKDQQDVLADIGARRDDRRDRGGRRGSDRGSILQRFLNLERTWFRVAMNENVPASKYEEIREIIVVAIKKRDGTTLEEGERGRPDFAAITRAVEEQREELHADLKTSLGSAVFSKLDLERGGFGFGGRGSRGRPSQPLRPQGRSALVFTDPNSGKTRLFDFINIVPRKSGYKVRLHKDKMLNGLRTMNVLFEPDEKTCINEALAFDLYRAAGSVIQRSGYLRLVMDDKLVGYHFWFEQANGAFLRHNDISDKGNLYKVTWQGSAGASEFTPEDKRPTKRQDVVRRYEKKSNPHDGYDDLIDLVEALEAAEEDDEKMWALIQERFDVKNAINYFVVNSLISHWDGFFNNYYLYHDLKRKKWMLFPFDQDSTWSQRMGSVESLSKMPLNFGSAEAVRGGFGRGERWWRDGGEISKPLLANPQFKKMFLTRLHELTDTVFREEHFGTQITKAENLLAVEVSLRAKERGDDETEAVESLGEIMDSLREHLRARRSFILSELKSQ